MKLRFKRSSFARATLALFLAACTLAECQQITVQTEAGKPTVLTRSDIEGLPHSKITAKLHDTQATFDVVPLKIVLEKAGITFDDKTMSGKRLASCLLVEPPTDMASSSPCQK